MEGKVFFKIWNIKFPKESAIDLNMRNSSFFLERFKHFVYYPISAMPLTEFHSPSSLQATPEEAGTSEPNPALNGIEISVIELFVSVVRMLGIPKSVAEIYGLLFISPAPLPLDTVMERLRISKGSTSQGLKFLRSLGAIKSVYVAGDRRDHYAAEIELKKLVHGFLKGEVEPRLESGESRLGRLRDMAAVLKNDNEAGRGEFYESRIAKLAQWHGRGNELIPLLNTLLE